MCITNTTNIDVLNKEWKYIGECIKFCWYYFVEKLIRIYLQFTILQNNWKNKVKQKKTCVLLSNYQKE